MKLYLFILFYFYFVNLTYSQTVWNYKMPPVASVLKFKNDRSEFSKVIFKDLKNYKNLTDLLPKNYVKSGTVDYTVYLQKGLDHFNEVIFPDFPILINSKGLYISSNSKIVFASNSKILMKGNSKELFAIFNVIDSKNISIYFPNLIGDKTTHTGKKGEWGMGIMIKGGQNINISIPKLLILGEMEYIFRMVIF
ncbi:hypothetical protein FSB73_22045 [Arachidicoccus ginsenosidivorans]|uniref:Uncharacterized protein n=1 Tax=Arachidicoccus ginsenosidivorans TaxID=496057 RepID=A0A5B8VR43_9BACT|nr:hypothetical protein [Arachidicoccus ginsenosidivorans]QEC73950.1 hypothetical protein FSB73_22045 [Arachidicoccus ginsenosidivorans]